MYYQVFTLPLSTIRKRREFFSSSPGEPGRVSEGKIPKKHGELS
jgi:hypothetical protein